MMASWTLDLAGVAEVCGLADDSASSSWKDFRWIFYFPRSFRVRPQCFGSCTTLAYSVVQNLTAIRNDI